MITSSNIKIDIFCLKSLTDAGVPCGPIYTIDKVFTDPQVLHRQMLKKLDHPKGGKVMV
ncbi:MAG TPA: CoA transferase, partial [bacterium]|nr:CoA transferase [bacterium]